MRKSIYKNYKLKRSIPENQEFDKNLLILLGLLLISCLYLLPECLSLKKQNNELESGASIYQETRNDLNAIITDESNKRQCHEYIDTINEFLIDRFQHKITNVIIQESSAQLSFENIDYQELYALVNDLESRKELKVSSIEISSSSSITTLNLSKG